MARRGKGEGRGENTKGSEGKNREVRLVRKAGGKERGRDEMRMVRKAAVGNRGTFRPWSVCAHVPGLLRVVQPEPHPCTLRSHVMHQSTHVGLQTEPMLPFSRPSLP